MIRTFKDKTTQQIFEQKGTRWFTMDFQEKVFKKLSLLDSALSLVDLNLVPSNHLEKLKGDRKGQYSIRADKKWRICFHWLNNDAYNVELIDYH